jgi:hypothetical protein
MTDIFTQDIKDLMKLANEDFDKFYKETEKQNKSSGNYSTAASSGNYSTAASSGDGSQAASSGYHSQAASSGDGSKAASSGNYSTAASSGNYSTAASSGDGSQAASSGYHSQAASSGDGSKAASPGNYSTAASSGNYSTAASSGDGSQAASSGYRSQAASSGDGSKAASSGNYSTAASSGDGSQAASSGYRSQAASSGYRSQAASSGNGSKAASSGDDSKAASSGENSACSALGYRAAVKGDLGNLLMCSEYSQEGVPLGGKADLVDGKILKPDCWYIVEGGEWVEVDFTDNLFHYVISTKGNVKKLKNIHGDTVYLVTDGEHSAHGDTIKQARESLLFKKTDRDTSEYDGLSLDDKKTPMEWAVAYHVITGACEYGCKQFMKSKKLKKQYTLREILEETKGAYGYEKFSEFFKGDVE